MVKQDAMNLIKEFIGIPKILVVKHFNTPEKTLVVTNSTSEFISTGYFNCTYVKIKPRWFDRLFKQTRYFISRVVYIDDSNMKQSEPTVLYDATGNYLGTSTDVGKDIIGKSYPNDECSKLRFTTINELN